MLKNNRLMIFIAMTVLILIGLIMIYSSSYIWASYKYGNSLKYFISQALFIFIGYFLINLILKLDKNFFYKNTKIFLIGSFILLILVLIPGIGVVRNGSRSWFGIASFGVQPSEFVKLALILYTAKTLSEKRKTAKLKDIKEIIFTIFLAFTLIMLEPDFGTGFIIVSSLAILLFVSGLDKKYFYYFFIIGTIGAIGLIIMAPYRMNRITSFINPWKDPLGTGFQIIQSLYAIGPGGLLGLGFNGSMQKHFYLPEPETDFIFSIICEEFGIIGALVIILLFIILFYNIIKLALNEKDLFKKYTIFGLGTQLIFQTILNLSVVVGLIPVTGVTLPFISYGGSSLLISMMSIGIILSLSKNT